MTACPAIAPLVTGAPRPFWSVMIPTYEPHPGYLAQALASVLAQDPGPATMEIALVDDGSSRVDPRRCLGADVWRRVAWFRHEGRIGMARNWNACIARARGLWVHLLHQDDLVRSGFYERLRDGIAAAPAVGAAFCRDVVIDGHGRRLRGQFRIRSTAGIVEDWVEHLFVGLHLRAAALVVRRSVYEALGGFRLDLPYALDWDMWKRIAATYPLWYEPEELACYRSHRGSASVGFLRSGANIADIRRSIELSEACLPAAIAADVSRRARTTYTAYAVRMAWRAFKAGHPGASLAQLREASKLTSASGTISAFARLVADSMGAAHRSRTRAGAATG